MVNDDDITLLIVFIMSTISPWKNDFPIFSYNAHPSLCYLDTAASSLMPKHVAEAIYHYQCFSFANSHQSLQQLNVNDIDIVEKARAKVRSFVGANVTDNVIFNTSGADSIYLVAQGYIAQLLHPDSNVIVGATEHQANLVPWQRLCQQTGATLHIAPITSTGTIDLAALASLIDEHTVLVAVNHISNIWGAINPIKEISVLAQKYQALLLVDGTQATRNIPVNFADLQCDFYVFSGHKMYSCGGIGVLITKNEHLSCMSPLPSSLGHIKQIDYQYSHYVDDVRKFENINTNIAGLIGLIEAIDYLEEITWSDIRAHIDVLSGYLYEQLKSLSFVQPILPWYQQSSMSAEVAPIIQCPSLVSLNFAGIDCHHVASLLHDNDMVLQAGTHHVAPFHHALNLDASLRISLGLYNDFDDIDRLAKSLREINDIVNNEALIFAQSEP